MEQEQEAQPGTAELVHLDPGTPLTCTAWAAGERSRVDCEGLTRQQLSCTTLWVGRGSRAVVWVSSKQGVGRSC